MVEKLLDLLEELRLHHLVVFLRDHFVNLHELHLVELVQQLLKQMQAIERCKRSELVSCHDEPERRDGSLVARTWLDGHEALQLGGGALLHERREHLEIHPGLAMAHEAEEA